MTRAKFKDIVAGRTLYIASVAISAMGERSTRPVEALRIAARPCKEPHIPEVPEAVRDWTVKVWCQHSFDAEPKIVSLFTLCFALPVPGFVPEPHSSAYQVPFTTMSAAKKFLLNFKNGPAPTAEELEHARIRERNETMSAEAAKAECEADSDAY